MQQHRITCGVLFLGLALGHAAYGQDTTDGFSWKMGPVDLNPGQTAKLIFANPFCSNPGLKLDVTIAITDLTGQVVQMRPPGSPAAPARKHAIINCNEAIQLIVTGDEITPNGTIVGILQIIPDLGGVAWVPVNVPLASLQIGPTPSAAVSRARIDNPASFQPYIVIIPVEPVRRLILP